MKRVVAAVAACSFLFACQSGEDKLKEKQKALEEAKARYKEEQANAGAPKTADDTPKDPFWENPSLVEVRDEGNCPEEFWALFPGPAPGADAAEKKANESKRAELVKKLKDQTYLIKFRTGLGLTLQDYNAAKGYYPLEVQQTIDCKDSYGNVTISVGDEKAMTPPSSAAKEGAAYTVRIWYAPPAEFQVPMKSMSEAKAWKDKNLLGLEARYIWKPGKASVDHKYEKVAKHVEKTVAGDIQIGGGAEDWGAGRGLHADVQAMRVSTNHGKDVIVEKK